MKHFLLKAFEAARTLTSPITSAYEFANLAAFRLCVDHNFLSIDERIMPHPHLQQAATALNQAKTLAQTKFFDDMALKTARGDFYPKPDIKPKLMNIASNLLPHLMPRMTPSTAAVIALAVGVGVVAMTLQSSGLQIPHSIPDAIAMFIGSKPNASPAPQHRIG